MRRKLLLPLLALVLAAAGLVQLGLGSAAGAVGAITDSSWILSNQKQGGTGVQWAFSFKTVAAGTTAANEIKTITFELLNSSGAAATFGGTVTLGNRSGIPAGTVAHASGTNKITYTVTTLAATPAASRINLTFKGITNPATKGNYTVKITTNKSSGTPTTIDQGSTPAQFVSTAVCVISENPAQPGASTALKSACLFGPAAVPSSVTFTDYTNGVWQNGAGRSVSATWGAVPTSSVTITGGGLGGGLVASDVNHSIEGTSGSNPGVDGIPAGDFITSVVGNVATLAYPITVDNTPNGSQTVTIANSTNRVSQNDGILNATTNCRGASTGDANLYACSASANFTAGDVGKIISGDAIPDGDTIASFISSTKVKLANGVPGTATPTGTVSNADFTIEAATAATSTRSVFDGIYSAGSDVCSTTAKFAASDIGLPVQAGVNATNFSAGAVITAVGTGATNPNGPACTATQTWATVSPAPTGSSTTITGCGIGTVCPELVVGIPLGTATANNDVVGTQGIELAVNPAVSPGSPPCAANHLSGFQLPFLWRNPGSFQLGIVGTSDFTGSAVNKTYTGQFLINTSNISFAGFLVQGSTGWTVSFPSQPVGLGVCPGTNLASTISFNGLAQADVSRVNTANGAVGPPGTGQVRGLKAPLCATGTTSTGVLDANPAYSVCKNTPAAGPTNTANLTTNKSLDLPTVISSCTVPEPAGFRWVQPTSGATNANTGFPCGNG